jgi:hypothetical protein
MFCQYRGVQHVPGEVERERLLQTHDRGEVALVASLGDPVEGVVGALDVRGVVLVVVQLQDLPVMCGSSAAWS